MRCVKRNQITIWYALYLGKEAITDARGMRTGEYRVIYDTPRKLVANVSAAIGDTQVQIFGGNERYSKVIMVADTTLPIDEYTVFWIDSTDTTKPHDYVVKRIAKSINSIAIAVDKVDVSNAETDQNRLIRPVQY